MVELKPCPFCGGYARMESGGPGCHYVRCDDCGACSDDGSPPRRTGRAVMTRSLDSMTACRARYQDSRSADRFMTRIRLLLNGIDPEHPMPAEQRDELRKLRWWLAEAIDNVLEDDMRLAVSLNPADAVRKIHAIASAFVLTSEMAGQQKEAAE